MAEYHFKDLTDYSHSAPVVGFGTGVAGDLLYDHLKAVYEANTDNPSPMTAPNDFATVWEAYLATKTVSEPFPTNWRAFINEWRAFANYKTDGSAPPIEDHTTAGSELSEFAAKHMESLLGDVAQPTDDWEDAGIPPPGDPARAEYFSNLFILTFGAFLKKYPYAEAPTTTESAKFFGEWAKSLTRTAAITQERTETAAGIPNLEEFPSYERIFKTFVLDDDPEFELALREFIRKMQGLQGGFVPGQHIDEWVEELVREVTPPQLLANSTDERARRNIMLLIFDILGAILDRLQETIAVQANRLAFLTDWQVRYTELMGRVPLYSANAPKLVGLESKWNLGDTSDFDGDLKSFAQAGVGAASEPPGFDDMEGFAGITLNEIRDYVEPGTGRTIPVGYSTTITATDGFRTEFFPGVFWFVQQPFGDSDTDRWLIDNSALQEERSIANQERQTWIEALRTRRGLIKDDAKQVQTDLSGTKEAITQQANFMSSIIQLLSGLLQSIFK